MKNAQTWAPTKFVLERGRLRAPHNPKEISAGSRLGDLVANCYHTHAKRHCRGRLLDLGCGKVPFYGLYREYARKRLARKAWMTGQRIRTSGELVPTA